MSVVGRLIAIADNIALTCRVIAENIVDLVFIEFNDGICIIVFEYGIGSNSSDECRGLGISCAAPVPV